MLDRLFGEAQHPVASLSQERFSLGILLSLRGVNIAINFDGEATIGTAKIDHEWADGMLAAKLQSSEAATAQRVPKQCLHGSLARAQLPRGRHVIPMPLLTGRHCVSVAEHARFASTSPLHHQPTPELAKRSKRSAPRPVHWARVREFSGVGATTYSTYSGTSTGFQDVAGNLCAISVSTSRSWRNPGASVRGVRPVRTQSSNSSNSRLKASS